MCGLHFTTIGGREVNKYSEQFWAGLLLTRVSCVLTYKYKKTLNFL